MDLGAHNILIDDDYNFLAVVGWEFAQTAPWQGNYYPAPLPLLRPDAPYEGSAQTIPRSFTHEEFTSQLYAQKLREVERSFRQRGRELPYTFLEVVHSPASQVFARFCRLGIDPAQDEIFVKEMVQIAFKFNDKDTYEYLTDLENRVLEPEDRVFQRLVRPRWS